MSWVYRKLIRPALFEFDSEEIHNLMLQVLSILARSQTLSDSLLSLFHASPLPIELFGLRFPNPVGLAAGMDKYAAALPIWECLGFGFCELGGVTRHPQPGNPQPRLFRVPTDEALINRMGFNNPGAEALAGKLQAWRDSKRWPKHPVGINLGKSKATPLDAAAEDYAFSFQKLRDYGDFFVVNVSSPNTPNLRQLQDKSALDAILAALQAINSADGLAKPILVKVAPDLSFQALDEILELVEPRKIAGLVATNTTITRPDHTGGAAARAYAESGGLSGKPLKGRSTEIIRYLYKRSEGKIPLIGSGGIFTAADAREKLDAGATLLQVYTGLIYEGPALAKQIVSGLLL